MSSTMNMSTFTTTLADLDTKIQNQRRWVETVRAKLAESKQEYERTKDVGTGMWLKTTIGVLTKAEEDLQDLVTRKMSLQYQENVRRQFYAMVRKEAGVV